MSCSTNFNHARCHRINFASLCHYLHNIARAPVVFSFDRGGLRVHSWCVVDDCYVFAPIHKNKSCNELNRFVLKNMYVYVTIEIHMKSMIETDCKCYQSLTSLFSASLIGCASEYNICISFTRQDKLTLMATSRTGSIRQITNNDHVGGSPHISGSPSLCIERSGG